MKWITIVLITEFGLISFIHYVWALQFAFVCHPGNATGPLACSPGEWVHIVSESYIPQSDTGDGDGSSCSMDFNSQCNLVKTDMESNCNGPSPDAGCRELVDVAGVRLQKPCFTSIPKVMVMIQYECTDGSKVINVCDGNIDIQSTSPTIYLASPTFPATDPLNTLCSCQIEGTRLTVTAIDINMNTKLPWDSADQYNSVLAVQNKDQVVWQSSSTCQNCDNLRMVNENLYPLESRNYTIITVTYSNYGLTGQIVWLQVTGLGQRLKASCTSSPLPPDRIITTTIPTTISTTATSTPSTTPSTTSSTTSSTTPFTSTSSSTSTSPPQDPVTATDKTSASNISTTTPTTEMLTIFTTETTQLSYKTSTGDMLSTSQTPYTTSSPDIANTSQLHITTSASELSTSPYLTPTTELLSTSPLVNAHSTSSTMDTTSSASISNTLETDNTTSLIFIPNTSNTKTNPILTQQESSEAKPTTTKLPNDASVQSIVGNKKEESSTIVILLAVILLVLLVIAVIVAVIVYRKRRRFTYNGKVGFKALFLSLYHGMAKRDPQETEEKDKVDFHAGTFDNIEMPDKELPPAMAKEPPRVKEPISQRKQPENNSGSCYITSPDVEVYFDSKGNNLQTPREDLYYELESECSGNLKSVRTSDYHYPDEETSIYEGGEDKDVVDSSQGQDDSMANNAVMPESQNHPVYINLSHGETDPSVPVGRDGVTSLETTTHGLMTSPLSPCHDIMLSSTPLSQDDVAENGVTAENETKSMLKVDNLTIPNAKVTQISNERNRGQVSHNDHIQQENSNTENEQLLSGTLKLKETSPTFSIKKHLPQNEHKSSLDYVTDNVGKHIHTAHSHTNNAHNNRDKAHNAQKHAHNHTEKHNAHNHRDNGHNNTENDRNQRDNAQNHRDNGHNNTENDRNQKDNAQNHRDNAQNNRENGHNHTENAHSHTDKHDTHQHGDNAHDHRDIGHNHTKSTHRTKSLENVNDPYDYLHDKENKSQLRRKLKAKTKDKSQGTQLTGQTTLPNELLPQSPNIDLTRSLPGFDNIKQMSAISPSTDKGDTELKDSNMRPKKSSRSRLVDDLLRQSLDEIKLKRQLEIRTPVMDEADVGSSDFSQC